MHALSFNYPVEVAIHQILYVRGLYPKGNAQTRYLYQSINIDSLPQFFEEIFATRQKYNTPVHMSRHPDINQYINHVVAACKDGIHQVNLNF
jgi:hypothetical protein